MRRHCLCATKVRKFGQPSFSVKEDDNTAAPGLAGHNRAMQD